MTSPILFLIFNRPDTTQQVFEKIKAAKPPRLYVAADGARTGKPNEQELCTQARHIATQVDWKCEVKTLFRVQNLGCRVGVSSAINWFFENEEEGIILEDDCVPDTTFFRFCDELLEKYRHNNLIGMITGSQRRMGTEMRYPIKATDSSYFFSTFFHIWGWASWRRAWKGYDVTMASWRNTIFPDTLPTKNKTIRKAQTIIFDEHTVANTWDTQWAYHCTTNNLLCVTPITNLITNIGVYGTHFNSVSKYHYIPTIPLVFPIKYVNDKNIIPNIGYDISFYRSRTEKTIWGSIKSLIIIAIKKIGLYQTIQSIRNNKKYDL